MKLFTMSLLFLILFNFSIEAKSDALLIILKACNQPTHVFAVDGEGKWMFGKAKAISQNENSAAFVLKVRDELESKGLGPIVDKIENIARIKCEEVI